MPLAAGGWWCRFRYWKCGIYLCFEGEKRIIILSKDALRDALTSEGSKLKGLAHMDTLPKICTGCKEPFPLSEFYKRPGQTDPTNPGQYTSECKACMKARSKQPRIIDNQTPYAISEQWGIDYLHSKGIPSLPGKSLSYAWVDVIAFGCVRVEVKFSGLFNNEYFKFSLTPGQKKRGLLGDVVMLVCDYGTRKTFHLFSPAFPAFYINGKLKTGFHFTPGAMTARKFGASRVVMTQPMMDSAQDNVQLIHNQLNTYCEYLKRIPFALPLAA